VSLASISLFCVTCGKSLLACATSDTLALAVDVTEESRRKAEHGKREDPLSKTKAWGLFFNKNWYTRSNKAHTEGTNIFILAFCGCLPQETGTRASEGSTCSC
ncbi:unnamed protein product, partial [Laminaria digitata]